MEEHHFCSAFKNNNEQLLWIYVKGGIKKKKTSGPRSPWNSTAYRPCGRDKFGGRCDLVFSVKELTVGISATKLSVRMFVSYLIKEAKFCYQSNNAS